jgi:hypothetical protein
MAENKNDFIVDGILYAKPIRKWSNASKGTSGQFEYYVLEIATPKRWEVEGKERSVTKKELVKFLLPRGQDLDAYSIGDALTIAFTLSGREYASTRSETGKDFGLELNATSVKFSDINRERTNPKRDPVFQTPEDKAKISDPESGNNDIPDDLPF